MPNDDTPNNEFRTDPNTNSEPPTPPPDDPARLNAKLPLTERRLAANRANARKSRGPKTPAGLEACADARRRAGRLASAVVLDCENVEDFQQTRASIEGVLRPRNAVEQMLVDEMAAESWRKCRLHTLEKRLVDRQIRRQHQDAATHEDIATEAAVAHNHIADNSRTLDVFAHGRSQADRLFGRNLSRFFQLRDMMQREEKREGSESPGRRPRSPEEIE
jgi:hypothetical protein